jgi:hypothetical protein
LKINDLECNRPLSRGGAVTRTEFGRSQFGSSSFGSRRGGGSPRSERFFSEDAERAAEGEMALDVEGVFAAPSRPRQIFDVAMAERETDIGPNGVPDDRRRELMAGK